MRIKSIFIQAAWSFGADGAHLEDLGSQTVIIGRNNSGKSKILAAIRWVQSKDLLDDLSKGLKLRLDPEVLHDRGDEPTIPFTSLKISTVFSREELRQLRAATDADPHSTDTTRQLLAMLLNHEYLEIDFGFQGQTMQPQQELRLRFDSFERLNPHYRGIHGDEMKQNECRQLWEGAIGRVLRKNTLSMVAATVTHVGGWRSLDKMEAGGKTIIENLHLWRDPPQKDKHLRFNFERIERLFQRLMLCDDIRLRPEFSGKALSLSFGSKYLSIESFGDGVQHLLMIAYHLVVNPTGILLIEEPETHLHPGLQRNLVRILSKEFKGQAFITTHSPAILDAGLAQSVIRVEHDGMQSTATLCQTFRDVQQVLDQLDVRASDLLQANLVIWVEGPTDRMFLKRCFDLLEAPVVEGLHYQIAYYGGRLRSHLTFEDVADELVNLLKLCRKAVMVCDSDKAEEAAEIDASKRRLKDECEKAGMYYWVTDGREIENYLPDTVLTRAYRKLMAQEETFNLSLGRYQKLADAVEKAFPGKPAYGNGWKVDYEEHKARVMPLLLQEMTREDLGLWGLDAKLGDVLTRISEANGGCQVGV